MSNYYQDLKEFSDAKSLTYFSNSSGIAVNKDLVEWLSGVGSKDQKKARVCLHHSPMDPLHEMLVFQRWPYFYPPKRNIHRDRSFHILKGRLAVFQFSEIGIIDSVVVLDTAATFFHRVAKGVFHLDLPLTDTVHLETVSGPFEPLSNEVAPFFTESSRIYFHEMLIDTLETRSK